MTDTATDLIALSEAIPEHPEQEPTPGTIVVVNGSPVRLQAVLERTCAVGPEQVSDRARRYLVPIAEVSIAVDAEWMPLRDWRGWNRQAAVRGRLSANAKRKPGDRTKTAA